MNEVPHFVIKVPRERINRDESRSMDEDFYFCIDRVSWIEKVILKGEIDSLIEGLVVAGLLSVKPEEYTYDIVQEVRENVQVICTQKKINIHTRENHRPTFTNQ